MLRIRFPPYTTFNTSTKCWWKHIRIYWQPPTFSKVKQTLEKSGEWLKALRYHLTCVAKDASPHYHFFIFSQLLLQSTVSGNSRREESRPQPPNKMCASNSRVDQEEGRKGARRARRRGRVIGRIGERTGAAPLQRSVWLHLKQRIEFPIPRVQGQG